MGDVYNVVCMIGRKMRYALLIEFLLVETISDGDKNGMFVLSCKELVRRTSKHLQTYWDQKCCIDWIALWIG